MSSGNAIAYDSASEKIHKINKDNDKVTNSSVVQANGKQIINIHVSAKNLPKADLVGESDPMCVMQVPYNGRYVEVARSEVIWNNNSPEFVTIFQANYLFNMYQPLRFSFYDVDSENAKLSDHDPLGEVDTDLSTLVQNIDRRLDIQLNTHLNHSGTPMVTLIPEQLVQCNEYLYLTVQVKKLKKMRTFSKNNPYILLSKCSEAGKNIPVYRSETVPKCYQCTFKEIKVPLQSLCNGDLDLPIDIGVVDNHVSHPDVPIGSFSLSIKGMIQNMNNIITLKNAAGKDVGQLIIKNAYTYKEPELIDYIRAGIRFNLITAVDFTGSNGSPSSPSSLHYLSQYPNQYEQCITAVGEVICPYDSDQQFASYGFGGKLPCTTTVNHCFPLSLSSYSPFCQGLNGILQAYKTALTKVALSGPTCFAPVIQAATGVAQHSFEQSRTYTILLILTDGCINDYNQTANAIVEASYNPISIIIVGVGNADFTEMELLDGDKRPLKSLSGKSCARDIVQFVPFRDFQRQDGIGLAESVLAEIPRQVISYCKSKGIVPAYAP